MNLQEIKTKLNTKVSDRTAWVSLSVLAVVLIVVIVSCFNKTNKIEEKLASDATNTVVDNSTNTSANLKKPVAKMSYANALNFYKDRRIQLDGSCQASPASMTFKNGTTIMIDNRSKYTRNLNIAGGYTVGAYDFITVKLYSNTLPKTILLDCGNSQNVATILLQK